MKLTTTVIIACLIVISINACDMINIAEEKSGEATVAICSPPITDVSAPIFLVNNEIMHQDSVKALKLELIKTVNVLPPDEATELYGTAGKNGAVLIQTSQQIKD